MLPRLPELTWPERVVGPPPTGREIRFVCLCSLAFAVLILALVLAAGRDRAAALGFPYEEDFVAFYGVGRLLNDHPPDRLYDFKVQEEIYLDLRPGASYLGLPYIHAPFEALLFKPLALLPYDAAYVVWLVIGALAFSAALWVLVRRFGPHERPERATAVLLALSFSPYMMESWLGGNITVIPFLALALAIALEDADRPVLSGCALALCLNKPSLLVLILPMLVVSRRFMLLTGFVIGASALVIVSSLVLGMHAWSDFVGAMLRWAQMTAGQPGLFKDWKYVDLNSFSRVLPGGRSWLGLSMTIAFSCWTLFVLLRTWLVLPGAGRQARGLAWAATISWTLVLNAYVPIYDCTLLVLAGVMTAAALRDPVSGSTPPAFVAAVALCYVSSWVTQPLAQLLRVQIFTLVLIWIGIYLLQQFQRVRLANAAPSAMERA